MPNLNKHDFPRCERYHCANNEKYHCTALITADFGDKMCPFYKSKDRARAEKLECLRRKNSWTSRDEKEIEKLEAEINDYQ